MFEKLWAALANGGPSVDAVLHTHTASPGEDVTGTVMIQGGPAEVAIGRVVVGLVAHAERDVTTDAGPRRSPWGAELRQAVLGQDVWVAANQRLDMPFTLTLPWETPITTVGDVLLPISVGVRTELMVHDARDTSDLDLVTVRPLPSQNRVLDAFGELGATFSGITATHERIAEVPQEFDSVRLQFVPPPWCADRIEEVSLSFIANPRDLCVVLGADRRGGLFRSGGEVFGRYHMSHEDAGKANWAAMIGTWLADIHRKR